MAVPVPIKGNFSQRDQVMMAEPNMPLHRQGVSPATPGGKLAKRFILAYYYTVKLLEGPRKFQGTSLT